MQGERAPARQWSWGAARDSCERPCAPPRSLIPSVEPLPRGRAPHSAGPSTLLHLGPGRGLPGRKQPPHRRPMGSRVLCIPSKPGQVGDCPGLGFLSGPFSTRPFVAFTDHGAVCCWRVQQSHRHCLRSHLLRQTSIPWTRAKGQGSTKRGWLLNYSHVSSTSDLPGAPRGGSPKAVRTGLLHRHWRVLGRQKGLLRKQGKGMSDGCAPGGYLEVSACPHCWSLWDQAKPREGSGP